MLKKTFQKLGETFDAMREEMKEISDGGRDQLIVRVKDGNVEIVGPLKELRINGKLVRFKDKP